MQIIFFCFDRLQDMYLGINILCLSAHTHAQLLHIVYSERKNLWQGGKAFKDDTMRSHSHPVRSNLLSWLNKETRSNFFFVVFKYYDKFSKMSHQSIFLTNVYCLLRKPPEITNSHQRTFYAAIFQKLTSGLELRIGR